MSDFLKCECPHCGQSIEYPAEGIGQTVPCPTCEKLITLTIAIQRQVKEDLQINTERNERGVLNEPQNQSVQIPAKGSIQNTEMVSILATETKNIVFKRVFSGKEPKLPKYLHYPPEPRPQDYNSGSDYDAVSENKKWMREIKKREAINRRLFVVHRAKFKLWNAKHNWGDDAWLPSSFPKSPLAPSDSEEVELQKALLENISLPTDSPLKKSEPETRRKVRLRTRGRVGNTLLHKAAQNGTLNQIPRELLTRETLTIVAKPRHAPEGFYFTGSGYKAKTETVLHIAALYGHGDQIPVEFLTPELLSIEAGGHARTVLHYFALSKNLDLIPKIYANSEMWNIRDRQGFIPRELQEAVIAREAYVARVRSEPATEKQKEKLRWFGCTFGEGITKGQASDALDKCVRDFPEKESAYYSRPPTEEQLEKIREINKESVRIDGEHYYDFENDGLLTYGRAKDLIQERGWLERQREREEEFNKHSNPPSKAQLEWLKESGITLDSSLKITEWELECIIGLEKLPPREEDLSLFKQHGLISFKGDGFGAFLFADLIRSFGGSAQDHNRAKINYGPPCQAALQDPAYHKPTLSRDWEGEIAFTWPKSKIREWLRQGVSPKY